LVAPAVVLGDQVIFRIAAPPPDHAGIAARLGIDRKTVGNIRKT
jgi:hypothetical protein